METHLHGYHLQRGARWHEVTSGNEVEVLRFNGMVVSFQEVPKPGSKKVFTIERRYLREFRRQYQSAEDTPEKSA